MSRLGAIEELLGWFPRHARWVAERTDAKVAEMAHQVGARPGTDDYLAMVDYNVRQVTGSAGGT